MESSLGFSSAKEEDSDESKEKPAKHDNLDESFEVLASASTNSFNSLTSSSFCNKIDSNYHSFLSTDTELKNLSPMSHSLTSLTNDEDPWKASAIGIKCISYKPIGYVFLTRKILDLYTTDGKRKLEILYSYSKNYKEKVRIPTLGTSLNHCSFCDTITLDFDPESSLFDLIMEVQIITLCPNDILLRKKSKLSKSVKNEVAINASGSSSSSSDSETESETTLVTSTYDIQYHKDDNRPNLYEVLKSVNTNRRKNSFEEQKGKNIILLIKLKASKKLICFVIFIFKL